MPHGKCFDRTWIQNTPDWWRLVKQKEEIELYDFDSRNIFIVPHVPPMNRITPFITSAYAPAIVLHIKNVHKCPPRYQHACEKHTDEQK